MSSNYNSGDDILCNYNKKYVCWTILIYVYFDIPFIHHGICLHFIVELTASNPFKLFALLTLVPIYTSKGF